MDEINKFIIFLAVITTLFFFLDALSMYLSSRLSRERNEIMHRRNEIELLFLSRGLTEKDRKSAAKFDIKDRDPTHKEILDLAEQVSAGVKLTDAPVVPKRRGQ